MGFANNFSTVTVDNSQRLGKVTWSAWDQILQDIFTRGNTDGLYADGRRRCCPNCKGIGYVNDRVTRRPGSNHSG